MSTIKAKSSQKLATSAKKIESPFAKYNSNGQLFCVVCNTQIKNDMYWTGHINGKAHRDTVTLLKNKGNKAAPPPSSSSSSLKRPASVPASSSRPSSSVTTSSLSQPTEHHSSSRNNDGGNGNNGISSSSSSTEKTYLAPKRLKLDDIKLSPMGPPPSVSILKKSNNGVSSSSLASQPQPSVQQPPTPIIKKTYKQIEEEEDALMEIDNNHNNSGSSLISTTFTLDDGEEDEEDEAEETEEPSKTDTLPPGFFDDAKEDAKARGIEYKNPDEAEWDKFVKEMATEDVKSSVLRTADEEDSAKHRELDEIEEQMKNWQRVVELERKAKEARQKIIHEKETNQHEKMNMSDDDEVDEDYDEDLDWRTKKKL